MGTSAHPSDHRGSGCGPSSSRGPATVRRAADAWRATRPWWAAERLERRLLLAGIASGQTVAGSITAAAPQASYDVAAAAGETIVLSLGDATAASGLRPRLRLLGPGGATVRDVSTNSVGDAVTATYAVPAGGAGTYSATVTDVNGTKFGDFTLELVKPPGPHAADADGDGGAIASGQTKVGSISRFGDLDAYTVSAAAGETIALSLADADQASGVRPWMRVFGPTGAQVGEDFATTTGRAVDVAYAVPGGGAGTYTVLVQDNGGPGLGGYTLELVKASGPHLADADGDGGGLVSGQTKAGSMNRLGDLDAYAVAAGAGETIVLSLADANAASGVRPWVRLYGPTGAKVAEDFATATNQAVGVTYVVPGGGAGNYTALVTDNGGTGLGGYTVELVKAPGPHAPDAEGEGGTLASGQTKTGSMGRLGDLDVYTLAAGAGETFALSFADADAASGVRPWMRVFGPTGAKVAEDFTSATGRAVDVTYVVPGGGAGTYTVLVQDNGGTGIGGYSLELAKAPGPQTSDADGEGGDVVSGQTKAGSMNRLGDLDVYTLAAGAGETFTLSFADGDAASGVRPWMRVFGPTGAKVGEDFTSATSQSVGVTYAVPGGGAGNYTVVVKDNGGTGIGKYTLELVKAPGPQAPDADGEGGTVTSGQTKAGAIGRFGDLDAFAVSAAAGETFTVSFADADAASGVRPWVRVFGPTGAKVGEDFTSATRQAVEVTYAVPAGASGTYTVLVQDNGGTGVGGYTLELAKAPGPHAADADGDGGPVNPGQTKVGTIGRLGDLDVYTVAAAAGEQFTLTLADADAASGVRPRLRVYNPAGGKVGEDFTSGTNQTVKVAYTVPAAGAGTYTVLVEDNGGTGLGGYTLGLAFAAPKLLGFQVDDGTAQRSMVRKLTVTFAQPVALTAAALTLSRANAGGSGANDGSPPTDASAALAAGTSPDGGYTWVYALAPGAFTDASGSLKDGIYTLVLNPAGVTGKGGSPAAGGQVTFHRRFGDQDGNKTINNADYVRFRNAFGSSTGGAAYSPLFDFDGNGIINNADYVQFRSRFGTSYTYP